jgi:hypothetical protein
MSNAPDISNQPTLKLQTTSQSKQGYGVESLS